MMFENLHYTSIDSIKKSIKESIKESYRLDADVREAINIEMNNRISGGEVDTILTSLILDDNFEGATTTVSCLFNKVISDMACSTFSSYLANGEVRK